MITFPVKELRVLFSLDIDFGYFKCRMIDGCLDASSDSCLAIKIRRDPSLRIVTLLSLSIATSKFC